MTHDSSFYGGDGGNYRWWQAFCKGNTFGDTKGTFQNILMSVGFDENLHSIIVGKTQERMFFVFAFEKELETLDLSQCEMHLLWSFSRKCKMEKIKSNFKLVHRSLQKMNFRFIEK